MESTVDHNFTMTPITLNRNSTPTISPSPRAERGPGGEVPSWPVGDASIGSAVGEYWYSSPELWDKLKPLAREKRAAPTQAEACLWQSLRGRRFHGLKFRRQHSIERFIVDFYCAEAHLIVEVDGPIHEYSREDDAIRQQFLEVQGFTVMRFTNAEVLTEMGGVLARIAVVEKRTSP